MNFKNGNNSQVNASYSTPFELNPLKVYYVDANNPEEGDGSVINPFQTMQLAIAAVIGTGNRTFPENPDIIIKVATQVYSISENIFINGITWEFNDGVIVNYNENAGYLIDTVIPGITNQINKPFKIIGGATFNIRNQGGFIRNVGAAYSQPYNRTLEIEVNNVDCDTAVVVSPNERPLIHVEKNTINGGYATPNLTLVVKGFVQSAQQHTIMIRGAASVRVYGNGVGSIGYGASAVNGTIVLGVGAGRLVSYINNEDTQRSYQGYFLLDSLFLRGDRNDALIQFEGFYGQIGGINQCVFSQSRGDSRVNRLIDFGDWIPRYYQNNTNLASGKFYISSNYIKDLPCDADDVVRWVGTTQDANKLDMMYNFFPSPYFVNPNVDVNGNYGGSVNIFGGQVNLVHIIDYADQATAVAAGLKVGDVFRIGNDLQIVI